MQQEELTQLVLDAGLTNAFGKMFQGAAELEQELDQLQVAAGSGTVRIGLKDGNIVRPSEPADEWMDLTAADIAVIRSEIQEKMAALRAIADLYFPAVTPKTIQ